MDKPFHNLNADERAEISKYPVKGEMALMALEQLQGAAKLIRSHRERFDGTGYPDHLSGLSIPLGARILAVAEDYDTALMGTDYTKALNSADASLLIQDGKGKRYDPAAVNALLKELGKIPPAKSSNSSETILRAGQILPGMILSQDVITWAGDILLAKEYVLTEALIDQIRGFERMDGHPLTIYVHAKK